MSDTTATLGLVLELKAKTDELRRGQQEIVAFAKSAQDASKAVGGIASGFVQGLGVGGALSVVGLLKTSISEVVGEMKALVLEGVHFNAAMETAEISVAGALRQFFPERFRSFNEALQGSAQVIDLLRQKSVEAGVSFDDLAHTYQATVGAMFRAGIFDLNKQVELVSTLQRSLAGLGVTGQRAARDIADIFNGQANRIVAAKALGISNEEITAAKQRGQLYEYLQSKLSGYKEAADFAADSTERLENRLANTKASVAADATKELSAAYKDLLKSLIELVKSDAFRDALKLLADAAKGSINVVKGVTDFVRKDYNNTPGNVSRRFDAEAAELAKRVTTARSQEDLEKIKADIKGKIDEINASMDGENFHLRFPAATRDRSGTIVRLKYTGSQIDEAGTKAIAENKIADAEKAREEAAARVREAEEAAGTQLEKNASTAEILRQKLELVGMKEESRLEILERIRIETEREFAKRSLAATGPNQIALIEEQRQKALVPILSQIAATKEKIATESERQAKAVDRELTQYFKGVEAEAARLEIEKAREALTRIDARKAEIQNDRYKTRTEKQAEVLELLKQEPAALDAIISKLELVAQHSEDAAAAQSITAEVNTLKKRRAKVPAEAEKNATPQTAIEEAQAGMVEAQNDFLTLGRAVANSVSVMIGGVSSGIEGLLTRSESVGEALRSVYVGLAQSVTKAISDMAAQWLVQHTVMAAISAAFREREIVGHSATEAAKTGVSVAGEGARTGTTLIGSLSRRGIHLAETIYHGVQVAIRTAAHIAGEIAKTAVSIVQAGLRIGVILAESIASVVKGAVEAFSAMASIPYVGPFLGAAAMAVALASGFALVKSVSKGFADGGYHSGPGTSRSDSIPIRVSDGEYTLSAPTVSRIGVDRLDAMNFGGAYMEDVVSHGPIVNTASPARRDRSSDLQGTPSVNLTPRFIVVDSDREAQRLADTEANEAYILKIARKHGMI